MTPRVDDQALRIAFAGTPEFATPCLRAVLDAGHDTSAVFTQPDRPAGRGRKPQPPAVKRVAREAGVPVYQPERLARRDLDMAAGPPGLDLLVVVAFGQILPAAVLAAPRLGAINVHASLLPRWRGAAPIARALLAGDTETGVSVIRMTEAMDAGPILMESRYRVAADETARSLHDRLAVLGADALTTVLRDPVGHIATARPQDPAAATFAPKLSRAEGRIDWRRPASEIARRVRALQPWPCAWTPLDGEPLRVLEAEAVADDAAGGDPATVLSAGREGVDVATGEGVLRLLRVQPAGGRAMAAADFANARHLPGCRLDAA